MADVALFLTGGEMGARVQAHDWATTPLGPAAAWPQSLRTSLGIMLNSGFPSCLAWGPELITFYNDGYVPILGTKQDALGRPLRDVWSESWDIIGPAVSRALAGASSLVEDGPRSIQRQGRIQANWLTFSYLPVRDETSGVGGILCAVLDKTDRVQAERRLRFQIDLGDRLHGVVEPREIMAASAELLGRYLGVGRAGYAEVDEAARFFEVERDWTDGTMPSLVGRHRLADFGPSITAGLRAGRVIRLDDVLSDPAAAGETVAAAFAGIHTRAGIAVPLMENGHLGAMLYVCHAEPRAWQDDEVVLLGEVVARTREAVGWARAEAARRDSEERFRLFAEHSTNALWILNVEQDAIEYVSPAFEQISGRLRSTMLGIPGRWIEPVHPEDQAGMREVLARILRGESSVTHEFRILRPDGSVRWLRDTWFPIRGECAGLQRVAGIAQDITRDAEALVYLVDADTAGRERLSCLLRGAGYRVQAFATARAFLEVAPVLASGCVLLKVAAPKAADNVALLQEIKERRINLPVVVLDDPAGDIGIAVRVMRAGAVDYQVATEGEPAPLLASVAAALAEVQVEVDHASALEHTRKVIAGLPLREREVLQGLLTGATNKVLLPPNSRTGSGC